MFGRQDTGVFNPEVDNGSLFSRRDRYEFNNKYKKLFQEKGVVFSGIYPKKNLAENY